MARAAEGESALSKKKQPEMAAVPGSRPEHECVCVFSKRGRERKKKEYRGEN